MGTYTGHIMTLANSIIGVSVLAMPFCFKQCGILLSVLMLIVSSIISRLACHFLMKSAILTKRRTYEFLAFHLFGVNGKFAVEFGIIGFLIGTCVAFFVVIGDLAPAIFAKLLGMESATATFRSTLLISIAIFCILPMGLLRNVDSLSSVCTATIGFYFCLVLKIITESSPHIINGDWVDKVELWRPAGVLQCLPIFSMSLCCQTQLFEMYDTLPNASLEKMNAVVRNAVNICTAVYIFIGFFGYVAFCSQPFTGNILMSFTPSLVTDVMKIGFVLSLAFSFPLVIFPCRASLFSLLKRAQTLHDISLYHIPEHWFKWLTITIVTVSLTIGLLIPSIELVLGLVGSTIGVMICILFPTTCFMWVSMKNTNEKLLAEIMFIIGLLMMVLGTYENLYAMEIADNLPIGLIHSQVNNVQNKQEILLKLDDITKQVDIENSINVLNFKENNKQEKNKDNDKTDNGVGTQHIILKRPIKETEQKLINDKLDKKLTSEESLPVTGNILDESIRQEPPQPVESEDIAAANDKLIQDSLKLKNKKVVNDVPVVNSVVNVKELNISDINGNKDINDEENIIKNKVPQKIPELVKQIVVTDNMKKDSNNEDTKTTEQIQIIDKTTESGRELLNELKKQVNEAKLVLEEIKEQKKELDRKQELNEIEKKNAVEQIKKIADVAIHSLVKEQLGKKSFGNPTKGDDAVLKLVFDKVRNDTLNINTNKFLINKGNSNVHSVNDKIELVNKQIVDKNSLVLMILDKKSNNSNLKNENKVDLVSSFIENKQITENNVAHDSQVMLNSEHNTILINNKIVNVSNLKQNSENTQINNKQKELRDIVGLNKVVNVIADNKSKSNQQIKPDDDFENAIKSMRRDILSNFVQNQNDIREKRGIDSSDQIENNDEIIMDNSNSELHNCDKKESSYQLQIIKNNH